MSGPTLQLNVTGTGQAKIDATTRSVESLVAALRTLPAAAAEVAKLQKALNAPAPGSGLKAGANDAKLLVGEIKNLSAQLATSFGSLEATIQKGWAKAASANAAGEAAATAGGRRKARTFTMPSGNEVDAGWLAKMQVGAERIEQRRIANEERAQQRATNLFMRRYEKEAEQQRRIQINSAKLTEASRVADEKALAQAAAQAARKEAAQERIDARHRANYDRQTEREAQRIRNLQVNSAKMAEAARMADEKALAQAAAQAARKEAAQERIDARHRANYDRQMEREAQRIRNLQINSAKMNEAARVASEREAAAIKEAADRVINAQRLADARFEAMTARGQARVVVRARSQLEQGVAPEQISQSLGSAALNAAQYTDLATAKQRLGAQAAAASPKVKGLAVAMGDAHSAARGLASGFGAMYLTWGHVAPLLAGAAVSQSFIKSISLGVAARQSLEEIRVLSQETEKDVAGLEAQMGNLARTGPFGPTAIAEAMKVLSLAGLNAKQVTESIKPTLDFSITGGIGIEKAAETLAAVGTAYGYSANQYSMVADAISKSAAISMTSVDSMTQSFRSSTMIAQAYGVSLKDTATGLALLANVGIRGSAAGVALRQMYSELSGASRVTREAMKKLGVEVLDDTGRMKDLLTITESLSQALTKFDGKSRVRAIQDISNERGGKGLVAALGALETQVRDEARKAGKNLGDEAGIEFQKAMTDKFRLIRDQMDEMAGFSAMAAAQLASTPEAMLKGVRASFEQSLVTAFAAIEPTLIVLSGRLRETFNSSEFQDGITSMVRGVAAVTQAIFENVDALVMLATAFGVYKGAQLLLLAMSSLEVVMGVFAARSAAAAAATAAVGTAATVAAPAVGRLAIATTALGATLRVLGPLGIALTLAGLAWAAYDRYSADATKTAVESDRQRNSVTIEALKAEADRLHDVNREMATGTEARYAEAKAKDESANASRRLAYEEGRASLVRAAEAARAKVAAEKLMNGGQGRLMVLPKLEREAAYAESQVAWHSQEYQGQEQRMRYEAARVRGEALMGEGLKAQEDAKRPKPSGKETWDGSDPRAEREKAMAQARADAELRSEEARLTKLLAQEQKSFDLKLKMSEAFANREITLENERVSLGLTSQYEASQKVLTLEAEAYARRQTLGEAFRLATAGTLEKLTALGTETGQNTAENFVENSKAALESGAAALDLSKAKAALKAQANFTIDEMGVPDSAFDKWKAELRDWQNTEKLLTESRNNFMDGFIKMGRDMWGEFLRTGKTSSKAFKDLLIDTLADITYKRFISGPLSQFGNEIFDKVMKPQVVDGTKESPADTFGYLKGITDSLGVSMQKLGTSFWDMLRMAGQGLAEMLQSAGSSGEGSFGSLLAKWFSADSGAGGSTGGYSGGLPSGLIESGAMMAQGGVFGGGRMHAFAKGGLVNSVVSSPTMFRFGQGGSSLGIVGEADRSEAIMPLERRNDGDLGVKATIAVKGGGGSAPAQAGPRTQVIIEDHSSGAAKPEVTQQRQSNGDEMIRVVIGAAAKDINRGGPLRKSVQGVQGRSHLPRY